MTATDTATTTSDWERWRDALGGLTVRHPDRRSRPHVWVAPGLGGGTAVRVSVDHVTSTRASKLAPRDERIEVLDISTVEIDFWPGEKLARQWFAAAWAGYCMHEALELVEGPDGEPPLDPHAEPYPTNPYNRCLRDAFPPHLDRLRMYHTLRLVMDDASAAKLLESVP